MYVCMYVFICKVICQGDSVAIIDFKLSVESIDEGVKFTLVTEDALKRKH